MSEASSRGWLGRGGQRETRDLTRPWVAVLIGQYTFSHFWRPRALPGAIKTCINFLIDFLSDFGTILAPKKASNDTNLDSFFD